MRKQKREINNKNQTSFYFEDYLETNKKNKSSKKISNLIFGILIIVLSFFTIILSGERMAFYTTFVYIISLIIMLNYNFKLFKF